MSRIRLLIASSLAVLAVGVVAASSASAVAGKICVQTAVAGKGNMDSSCNSNVGGTKNNYILITKLGTKIAHGEWCAKAETAGTGEFEANTCTGVAGTNFIKVLPPTRLEDSGSR